MSLVDPFGNSAYIDRLQEDIKIACHRLEEQGHESLVVTFSKDGHLVYGSQKGKRYLEEREFVVTDFFHYCADLKTYILFENIEKSVHNFGTFTIHVQASTGEFDTYRKCTDLSEPSLLVYIKREYQQRSDFDVSQRERTPLTGHIMLPSNLYKKPTNRNKLEVGPLVKLECELYNEVLMQQNPTDEPVKPDLSEHATVDSDKQNTSKNDDKTLAATEMFDDDTDDYDDTEFMVAAAPGDAEEKKTESTSAEEKTVKEKQFENESKRLAIDLFWKKTDQTKLKELEAARQLPKVVLTRLKDKLNNTQNKLNNRLNSTKKTKKSRNRVSKKSGKSKVIEQESSQTFPCGHCGLNFKLETHLSEHNQSNPDCQPEREETSYHKYQRVLDSKLTFKDESNNEIKTKTIQELFEGKTEPYSCEVCQRECGSAYKLKRHVFKHSEVKPFVCNICYLGFVREVNLIAHVRLHDSKPHYCTKCRSRFEDEDRLEQHMIQCMTRDLTCVICAYEASSRQDLSEHRSTVHRGLELHKRTPRPPYGVFPEACDICGKQLKSKLNVLRHKQSFHNESYAFRCDVCDQRFKTQISLRRHKTAHEKPRYKCESFHNESNPFHCDICDQRFKTQISLRRQKTAHEKPRYKCEICGFGAPLLIRFKNHMISHTKEKQYVCDLCGKQFRDKQRLDNHRRIHTGETPYKCDFEGCSKQFRSAPLLRQHKFSHATSHTFICDICGKGFKVKSQLRHHRKDHTIEFRWPCQYCEDKFKSVDRYKTHIARVHPDKCKEVEDGSNIKFYPCSNCSRVMINIEDYREHSNIHTGSRPHKCRFCGKSFSSRKNMRQHEKSHTGEQKLRCRLCPKKYSDPSVLKEHLRNRHGIEPDDQEMSAFVKDSEEKAHLRNEFQKSTEVQSFRQTSEMHSYPKPVDVPVGHGGPPDLNSIPPPYGQHIFPDLEVKPMMLTQQHF